MTELHGLGLGERVAGLRRRRGVSQRVLGAEVGRSESWVSQVERGVIPIERLSVLQALAEALGATVRDLRPEAIPEATEARPQAARDLDGPRAVLTGHPALPLLFARKKAPKPADADGLGADVELAWQLPHASRFLELTDTLVDLTPRLEAASRTAPVDQRHELHRLLARAYEAAAAAFARQDEDDAAWLAADRAIGPAEAS